MFIKSEIVVIKTNLKQDITKLLLANSIILSPRDIYFWYEKTTNFLFAG